MGPCVFCAWCEVFHGLISEEALVLECGDFIELALKEDAACLVRRIEEYGWLPSVDAFSIDTSKAEPHKPRNTTAARKAAAHDSAAHL